MTPARNSEPDTPPVRPPSPSITVAGGGILGLWQALTLARAGHRVRLLDACATPFAEAASRFAGAMLAPYCEGEAAPDVVREQGIRGLAMWRAAYPQLVNAGSLVVALPRDKAELNRFERMTSDGAALDAEGLAKLEPELAGRFGGALYFADEAHMAADAALAFLLAEARAAGADIRFGVGLPQAAVAANELIVDCRGLAARRDLPDLRGVRGERLLLRANDVVLRRPVRLLHPRHPIYVVPWGDGRFVVGATVIESEEQGSATVRSVLELLGAAYALHPGFGEAEIVDVGAGVRPAYSDNVPRVRIAADGRTIYVNGAYRHGFLLAPVLAEAVAAWIASGDVSHPLIETGRMAPAVGKSDADTMRGTGFAKP